jgi:undecaprenyl-diphosphatase
LSFDASLFRLVNEGLGAPWLDGVMLAISSRLVWVLAALIILGYLAWRRRGRALVFALLLGATLGVSDFVTFQVLKPTFSRMRPCYALQDVRLVQPSCGGDYGLPSNHAANAMAMAVAISVTSERRRVMWPLTLALTFLVGLSRVYLGVHYPGDVLAGFAVGALVALPAVFAWRRWGDVVFGRLAARLATARR